MKVWANLLWGLALFGLLLLPSNFRAGAEIAHGHSLVQLWVDAGDGTVHHEHHRSHPPAVDRALATSWLEPLIGDAESAGSAVLDDEQPDVAEQEESAPIASGVHLLLMPVVITLAIGARPSLGVGPDWPLAGLSPRVVLPPPRWTLNGK